MWFIWPRERTSMWSYLLLLHFKRTRNGRAREKPTKNALRFNGMWNQPPPPKKSEKMCFFPLSKRASSIGKMVIHFVCSSLSTAQFRKKKNDQLSRQLRRAPPTARRPSTPTRWPRRARLPRLPPSWKLKDVAPAVGRFRPCLVCFVRVQTLKGRKVDARHQNAKSKIQGKKSIRQKPPTPKIAVL